MIYYRRYIELLRAAPPCVAGRTCLHVGGVENKIMAKTKPLQPATHSLL